MEFGLREKKFAQTKLAILKEVIDHIESEKNFDDLSNKEICRRVEISEATFYNYFPQRRDIFKYLFKLWEIEIRWRMEEESPGLKGLKYLVALSSVRHLCKIKNPRVLSQLIAIIAKQGVDIKSLPVSDAEILFAFPEMPDIEKIPRDNHLIQVYIDHLEYAKKHGEVAADLDSDAVAYALIGVGIAPIIFLKNEENAEDKIQAISDWHMNLILNGLRIK